MRICTVRKPRPGVNGLTFSTLKESFEAAPGFSFDETLTGEEVRDSGVGYKGTHGYLPTDPRMHASLLIYGTDVRAGAKQPLARMIDLAPTIAGLLKVKLPSPEGRPLTGLVR